MSRLEAAHKLARLRDPAATSALLDAYDEAERTGAAAFSGAILEALVRIGAREAEGILVSQLRNPQEWLSKDVGHDMAVTPASDHVAPKLVELGGTELLLRHLFDLLADEQPALRAAAAGELANILYRSTVGYSVTTDGAGGKLTDAHRELMYGPLHSALSDTEARVRERAVVGLGDLGNTNALEDMVACLDDDNDRVRHFVAKALGDLGDVRAVEPLQRFAERGDWTVARVTREALDKLTRREPRR